MTKEIADGVIQAKRLKVFKAANNPGMLAEGLNQLIYNLTFSPNVRNVDLSKLPCNEETNEMLTRFFKISGSIVCFTMQHTTGIPILSQKLFFALAFNKTIEYINFDNDHPDATCV
jgi:hypothetical protein